MFLNLKTHVFGPVYGSGHPGVNVQSEILLPQLKLDGAQNSEGAKVKPNNKLGETLALCERAGWLKRSKNKREYHLLPKGQCFLKEYANHYPTADVWLPENQESHARKPKPTQPARGRALVLGGAPSNSEASGSDLSDSGCTQPAFARPVHGLDYSEPEEDDEVSAEPSAASERFCALERRCDKFERLCRSLQTQNTALAFRLSALEDAAKQAPLPAAAAAPAAVFPAVAAPAAICPAVAAPAASRVPARGGVKRSRRVALASPHGLPAFFDLPSTCPACDNSDTLECENGSGLYYCDFCGRNTVHVIRPTTF